MCSFFLIKASKLNQALQQDKFALERDLDGVRFTYLSRAVISAVVHLTHFIELKISMFYVTIVALHYLDISMV